MKQRYYPSKRERKRRKAARRAFARDLHTGLYKGPSTDISSITIKLPF
jgi:hypothetical protein